MSEERLNELFSIVNEGYSSIQEREIRDYITNLQQKVEQLEKDNYDLDKENQMLFEENLQLKKQLEEWKHHLECSKEMLDIQGQKGNYDFDEYMLGLYNGMEYIIALFETREPNFISGKDVEFTNNKTQQKEFIEYLENEIYSFELRGTSPEYNFENVLKRILLKYKEIIGYKDEQN